MAGTTDVAVATGLTITFGTTSYAGEIIGCNLTGVSRTVIDTSHMGTTGARTKAAGKLYEPGTLEVSVNWKPDAQPPITTAEETITLTFPSTKANGATLVAPGFVSAFSGSFPLEEKMTGSFTIQLTDDHAWTDAST